MYQHWQGLQMLQTILAANPVLETLKCRPCCKYIVAIKYGSPKVLLKVTHASGAVLNGCY